MIENQTFAILSSQKLAGKGKQCHLQPVLGMLSCISLCTGTIKSIN